jgi:hypothetical protein
LSFIELVSEDDSSLTLSLDHFAQVSASRYKQQKIASPTRTCTRRDAAAAAAADDDDDDEMKSSQFWCS